MTELNRNYQYNWVKTFSPHHWENKECQECGRANHGKGQRIGIGNLFTIYLVKDKENNQSKYLCSKCAEGRMDFQR